MEKNIQFGLKFHIHYTDYHDHWQYWQIATCLQARASLYPISHTAKLTASNSDQTVALATGCHIAVIETYIILNHCQHALTGIRLV